MKKLAWCDHNTQQIHGHKHAIGNIKNKLEDTGNSGQNNFEATTKNYFHKLKIFDDKEYAKPVDSRVNIFEAGVKKNNRTSDLSSTNKAMLIDD